MRQCALYHVQALLGELGGGSIIGGVTVRMGLKVENVDFTWQCSAHVDYAACGQLCPFLGIFCNSKSKAATNFMTSPSCSSSKN